MIFVFDFNEEKLSAKQVFCIRNKLRLSYNFNED